MNPSYIDIVGLLNRDPVSIDTAELLLFIKQKRVLVTGAAGSIGSELVRQIANFEPECIILFDHNENGIFFLERELKDSFPNQKIISRLGSIRDRDRVLSVFKEVSPDIVYHAAANKHVPLSEDNVREAIENNILGTYNVADIANMTGCIKFVLISTDKAVNPTSVMGTTKRIAEYYLQLMSQDNCDTKFITVRFGNVLGSSGSVVPIFQSQIDKGGPVIITHPDMQRFFMTIPEAAQLVLQSTILGEGGEIFVLDMGQPIKIVDLANKMIIASGLRPNIDIKIEFSGLRPGEKLYEELSFEYESTQVTKHPKIRNTKTVLPSNLSFNNMISLEFLSKDLTPILLKKYLNVLVPEAKLQLGG